MSLLDDFGSAIKSRMGLGSQAGQSDYNGLRNDWLNKAGSYADRWQHVADFNDPKGDRTAVGKRFDELSGLYSGEIDRGAATAGEQAAGAYSRRGAGDSGYATGAQSNIMLQAAQARAQAREAAREASVGEAEGMLGAETQTALSPYASLFGAAAQRYIGSQNLNQQFNQNQAQTEEEWFQNYGKMFAGKGAGGGAGG